MLEQIYPYVWTHYLTILAVFLRLLGVFVLVPGFSHRAVPNNVRILLALTLSLALFPIVKQYLGTAPDTLIGLAFMAIRETTVGLLIGFSAYILFEAVNLGGQFIGTQMGFGMGGMMDPQMQSSVTVVVPFYSWMMLMLFFVLNLHHEILTLFVNSFRLTAHMSQNEIVSPLVFKFLVEMAANLFVIAVKIAAPFTLLLLTCNVSVGVLSRMMPQLNVLLFSFPITILLGFFTFYIVAPDLISFVENALGDVSSETVKILRSL